MLNLLAYAAEYKVDGALIHKLNGLAFDGRKRSLFQNFLQKSPLSVVDRHLLARHLLQAVESIKQDLLQHNQGECGYQKTA